MITEKTLVQILVTGSIHLVGGVLQIVDPNIFDRSENEEIQQISEEYHVTCIMNILLPAE